MGNRAVIAFRGTGSADPCVYLHWNGGEASVEGFLAAARALQIEPTAKALHAAIWPFFHQYTVGDGPQPATVYLDPFGKADCDNGDNGLYWINDAFLIVGREFNRPHAYEHDVEKTAAIRTLVVALNALL